MIGGNVSAVVQVKDSGTKNSIGERIHTWTDVTSIKGWLDFQGGQNDWDTHHAKVQESTHVFVADYKSLKSLSQGWVWDPFSLESGVITSTEQGEEVDATSENARMVVEGNVYQMLMVDDPMGLHHHLEIFLKYIGGGQGV